MAAVSFGPRVRGVKLFSIRMTLPAGTRLGPYEILSPIGAGGMGEVYRARDSKLQRDVAMTINANCSCA